MRRPDITILHKYIVYKEAKNRINIQGIITNDDHLRAFQMHFRNFPSASRAFHVIRKHSFKTTMPWELCSL